MVSSRPFSSAAADQAVHVLHRGDARQAVLLGQAHELVHAIGRLVGQADVAHLALLDQLVQRLELLVDGGLRCAPWSGRSTSRRTSARCARASGSGRGRSRRSSGAAATCSQDAMMSAAVMPAPSRTQGMPREGPATLVASTSFSRMPGCLANQLPMMVSVAPKVSLRAGTEYISAVSMKLMPRSSARSRMAWASACVDLLAEGHGAQADGRDLQVAAAELDLFALRCWMTWKLGGKTRISLAMPEGPSIVILQGRSQPLSRQDDRARAAATPRSRRSACSAQRVEALRSWGKHFLIEMAATSRCACTS